MYHKLQIFCVKYFRALNFFRQTTPKLIVIATINAQNFCVFNFHTSLAV